MGLRLHLYRGIGSLGRTDVSGWNRTGGCPSGFHPSGFRPGFHPVLVGVIRADEKPDGNRMDVRRTDIRLSGPIRTEPSGRMRENFIRPDGCPVFIRFFIQSDGSRPGVRPAGLAGIRPDIRPVVEPVIRPDVRPVVRGTTGIRSSEGVERRR